MPSPEVQGFFDPQTYTISYVVSDPSSKHCLVIDSVLDFDPVSGRSKTDSADKLVDYVRSNELLVQWHLETHVHADHLSAAPYLQEKLSGKLGIGEHISQVQEMFGKAFNAEASFARDGSQFDRLFADEDCFELGNISGRVLHTPGHTPACVCYLIGDAVFVGDTLFMPDYGTARCDFPGGDAHALYHSIQRLLSLDDSSRVFLCHDYLPQGRDEYQWQSTIAEQKKNIHLTAHNEASFVAMRQSRDAQLNMPRLILPAVQVNMRAGHLPPAEDNGQVYLKTPINLL